MTLKWTVIQTGSAAQAGTSAFQDADCNTKIPTIINRYKIFQERNLIYQKTLSGVMESAIVVTAQMRYRGFQGTDVLRPM